MVVTITHSNIFLLECAESHEKVQLNKVEIADVNQDKNS